MRKEDYIRESAYARYKRDSEREPEKVDRFRDAGQIEEVVIYETGEVCEFVWYYTTAPGCWVGGRREWCECAPWHGPYRVAYNAQDSYWVAYARMT